MNGSKETKKAIIKLFNRTELREGEVVIDNRDSCIAKELNLSTFYVSHCISRYLEDKFYSLDYFRGKENDIIIKKEIEYHKTQIKRLTLKLNR